MGLLCGGVLVVFVVFTRCASVLVPLKAILVPACLNKLVTFLIFGDMKVKEAHFSFFLGFVRLVGEGGLNYFLLWIREVVVLVMCRMVCHSFARRFLFRGRLSILSMRNL